MRTYVYIDGFNFYYRAVKDTLYKWLDFNTLFQHLLSPKNQIISIKYFTALVSGKFDPDQPIRQKTYLRAIQKYIPQLSVYYGHFLSHEIFAPLAKPEGNKRFVRIIKTEEKGSDVNLAIHVLNDAWLDLYDCAVIVSNDSDLAESLRLVKEQHNKIIGLITPGKGHPSRELLKYADFTKRIRKGVLSISQL
ncbi:MAG: NYN domain-containing protein, partial [Desulfobacterales bacterium]|nr:NYN domain-containing protein [Desulfobacterales bacterium]